VLWADNMGLAPLRPGVEFRESTLSRCSPLVALTAANELGVDGWGGGTMGGCALTAVNFPALTGVKLEGIIGRGISAGGVEAALL